MSKPNSTPTKFAGLILSAIFFANLLGTLPTIRGQVASSPSTSSAKDLEDLFDPIFAERMETLHVPGAVVAVVKDGKILFTKGYGYASLEKKIPVVADKTLFRIGSITKVFTATAVMQMADRGKIKLDDDVNKYLKGFKVPATFPQPITFANLLTHTSGLDEISPGRHTADESKVVPLGAFLKTRLVRQLPPGEIISYSTYNAALAGFIVEQITETPFKVYLRRNVFEPLRMNRTSITAVPPALKEDLATGYEYDGKVFQPLKFQWFNTYPASDINTTAPDMARYILAQLADGTFDGQRILSERSAREMQRTHFRNHPHVSGWNYGFYEGELNNLRFVEHGGSMDDGYSALMTLWPEQHLGLFVACNTETGGFGLGEASKKALLDHYFPVGTRATAARPTITQPRAMLERFAGKYRPYIYCHSCSPDAAGVYIPEPAEVKVNDDGTLAFRDGRWRQIEPLLFELATGARAGHALLAFRESHDGKITYMFQEAYQTYERIAP